MYAVIRTGGKQYRVAPQDVIKIEKLAGAAGDSIEFNDVLMVGGDGDPRFGTPVVDGAVVAGEVIEQTRGPKIVVFKKKRRKNYRRKKGHRQDLTAVRITEILTGGKKPAKAEAAAKKSDVETGEEPGKLEKPAEEAKPAAEAKAEKPAAEKKDDEKPNADKKKDDKKKAKASDETSDKVAADEKPAAKAKKES